jgi:general secretion pathway protein J
VRSLRLRYRDIRGEWRDRWDPTLPNELPRAVDMVVDIEGTGQLRQVFLVGTGA